MRIVQMRRFGGPEVLEVVEIPTPSPGPGEVLVRVGAAGINFADTLLRQDRYAVTPELPTVPGSEVAGTVAAVGPDVRAVRRGDRVAVPLFGAFGFSGGYTDHVVSATEHLVPIPDGVSFEAATALMIQGITALLLTRHRPPRGKRVLVSAAAGGVGSLLVQLARSGGAELVIAGASSREKLAAARALGAHAGVDYTARGWVDELRALTDAVGPDLVYESAGGQVTKDCLAALAPGGELLVYGALNIQEFAFGVPELLPLIFKNQSLSGFAITSQLSPETTRAALTELFALAASGSLRVTLGGSYPLARAADAHRALESRGTMGKLVLVP